MAVLQGSKRASRQIKVCSNGRATKTSHSRMKNIDTIRSDNAWQQTVKWTPLLTDSHQTLA